ncbi:MAG: DUF1027 domain-containing protein [Bacilli bacterium]|nr:DUF1027 domain-containing protein [Bacilli bacterium]
MQGITLDNNKYKLIVNYRDGFDLEALKEKYTEYFYPYDYILGDWSYGKVRLKGFYKPENKNCTDINNFKNHETYLKDNCAYECRHFIIEKVVE